MQDVDLRRTQEAQTVNSVRLREAIKQRVPDGTVEDVARKLGVNGTTVLRWREGPTAVSLDNIVALEDALGLPRGELLMAAGYVGTNAATLEQMISWDSRLNTNQRAALLEILSSMVKDNFAVEPTPIASAPTRRAARKRPRPSK